MITEHEKIFDISITYDVYVKREMEQYGAWMPFSYGLTSVLTNFINDHFYLEREKPEVTVWVGYDYASHRREITLSVKIKESGYGEAILFSMDVFASTYDSQRNNMANFVTSFIERFQKNILRSAVMEKIHLYRNPPAPIIDWEITLSTGLVMGKTAIRLGLAFLAVLIFIIYLLF